MKFSRGYKTPDGRPQSQIGYKGQGQSLAGHHDPLRMRRDDFSDYVLTGFNDDDLPADQLVPPEFKGEPIRLIASLNVPSGAPAQTPAVDSLRNALAVPIEIHELNFLCKVLSPTQGPLAVAAGPIIGVQLNYGSKSIPLTQGAIPLNLLSGSDVAENNTVRESASLIATGGEMSYSFYNVKLSHPIWLAPGEALVPSFAHGGQINSDVTVYVSFSGRVLGKQFRPPRHMRLPFFAAFVTPIFGQSTVNTFTSTEKQLVNPTNRLMHVTRFIGQISAIPQYGATNDPGVSDNIEQFNTGTGSSSDVIRVSMFNSDGYPTIAPLTPFRLAFDLWTRELVADTDLPPHGYYIATVDTLTPPGSVPPTDRTQTLVGIGMRGYRELDASEVLP